MIKNETGRSMVEMLGVLAIIGVLSVAGIAGYSMAMKKYRANEILNMASQAVIIAQTANAGEGYTSSAWADVDDFGFTSSAWVNGVQTLQVNYSSNKYGVKVGGNDAIKAACAVAADNVNGTSGPYTLSCA